MEIIALALVVIVWYVLGFFQVREDEFVMLSLLGNPWRIKKSGLRHRLFLLERPIRFPTKIIELEFGVAGVFTMPGEFDGVKCGQANVGVQPSLYFRWPEDFANLKAAIRTVGDPSDIDSLVNLFEESVLDAVRKMGGKITWRELLQERTKFGEGILEEMGNQTTDILKQTCIRLPHVQIKHVKVPQELLDAITKPEVARYQKQADITKAEGDKQAAILKIEAEAKGRRILFDAIGEKPEDMQKEIMFTLRGMADGTASTIFLPTEITTALSSIFGKGVKDFTPEDYKSMLGMLFPKRG